MMDIDFELIVDMSNLYNIILTRRFILVFSIDIIINHVYLKIIRV